MFNVNGTITLIHTTVTSNTVISGTFGSGLADNGIAGNAEGGAFYLLSSNESTLGDVISATSITLIHSILANSIGGNDLFTNRESSTSLMINASKANIVETRIISGGGTINISGVNTTDPKLRPLADNKGETRTCAIVPPSSAIDSGYDVCPNTDQRGIARLDGTCDLGAYEFVYPDMGLNKNADFMTLNRITTVTYTLIVTNSSSDFVVDNVVVSDTIPLSTTLIFSNATRGSYTPPLWSLGSLESNAVVTLTVGVTTDVQGQTITNAAVISNPKFDEYLANNSDVVSIVVESGKRYIYLPIILKSF